MYMHTTRINTKKELRQNSGKEATMARTIFHIDVNSAFLSWTAVEQLKNGSKVDLREIPAIIGGDQSSRHGIVLAKSSLAKSYGIQTGEPVVNAFRKCPNLVTAPPNHKMYREKSRMLILVSMGKEGSRAYYNGSIVEVKPFLQKNTIETTGAGDTFCGCVLHYICEHGMEGLQEENLNDMLTFANAAASVITTRKGALRVMPTRDEIQNLLIERAAE